MIFDSILCSDSINLGQSTLKQIKSSNHRMAPPVRDAGTQTRTLICKSKDTLSNPTSSLFLSEMITLYVWMFSCKSLNGGNKDKEERTTTESPPKPCHAEYFMYYTPPIFLTCNIPYVSMYFQSEWETVWILISWLRLYLQCFFF